MASPLTTSPLAKAQSAAQPKEAKLLCDPSISVATPGSDWSPKGRSRALCIESKHTP